MQADKWNHNAKRFLSGAAACLLAASLTAPASAGEGFVRVTDGPTGRTGHHNRVPVAPRQAVAPRQPAGQIIQTSAMNARTGNPVTDLMRTASMTLNGTNVAASNSYAWNDGGCSSCQSTGGCSDCGCGCGSGSECGNGCGNGCGSGDWDDVFDDDGSCFDRLFLRLARLEYRCKRHLFGYFMPDGCCGQGCPPHGHYHLLYSNDPRYFDARDGGVYAAQGYGVPVAVPLAPNVRHTYNYGWGIPSSRLTPISTRAPF